MKNLYKLFGVVVLVAGIVLAFSACSNDSTDGDNIAPSTDGSLTVTGLEGYNDRFAIAMSYNYPVDQDPNLFAAAAISNTTFTAAKITNGSVTLNVWKMTGPTTVASYNGSDYNELMVYIVDVSSIPTDFDSFDTSHIKKTGMIKGTFANGKLTKTIDFEG